MGYVSEAFTAHTYTSMAADANVLPIGDEATADLTALLADDGAYTYAALKSDVTYETVKLSVTGGVLVMERAQGGTLAVSHPCGTCVSLVSPTTIAGIKALMCEYDCCEEGDCECAEVSVAGINYPDEAVLGQPYAAHIAFNGTLPIYAAVKDAPGWMDVTVSGALVVLSGTPTSAGTTNVIVSAANCNGTKLAIETIPVRVTDV